MAVMRLFTPLMFLMPPLSPIFVICFRAAAAVAASRHRLPVAAMPTPAAPFASEAAAAARERRRCRAAARSASDAARCAPAILFDMLRHGAAALRQRMRCCQRAHALYTAFRSGACASADAAAQRRHVADGRDAAFAPPCRLMRACRHALPAHMISLPGRDVAAARVLIFCRQHACC